RRAAARRPPRHAAEHAARRDAVHRLPVRLPRLAARARTRARHRRPEMTDTTAVRAEAARFQETFTRLTDAVHRVIVGQDDVVEGVLVALFAGGHVLLEGVPGIGKTMLVKALGDALHLGKGRIQFTPDLMPADVLGTMVLEEGTGGRAVRFQPGPIHTNLLLADEINRATPTTQSALLEAMQELQATVGGETRRLPQPFVVLATQNPVEQEGTYPLP